MQRQTVRCRVSFPVKLWLVSIGAMFSAQTVRATDYFLTLGGGYDRTGNQASLEANVVFLQQILSETRRRPLPHDIFFADGHDADPDLQVLAEKPAKSNTPATDLLASLHRRRGCGFPAWSIAIECGCSEVGQINLLATGATFGTPGTEKTGKN